MLSRTEVLPHGAFRTRGRDARLMLPDPRVLALIVLFLLPVQMQAGAAEPHPHALLHLLLDARDGTLDHHAVNHDAGHHDLPAGAAKTHDKSHQPDVPQLAGSDLAGGVALLAAIIVLFWLPADIAGLTWPVPNSRRGRLPGLDPPPPRAGRT